MTRTRPTQHGGRGGGHGAVCAPASRASRSPKRLIAGGLAAVTVTGAAVTFGGIAQAENPPLGPGNIEIFAKRDMVALEGYTAQAGENATVTVSRGGQVIGIGEGTIDETGFLEFNHPGGECWIGVTPNIRGGDLVEVAFSESAFVDGATVGSAVITSVTASAVTPTAEEGDVEGTVTITGTYGSDVSTDRLQVEVVNPDMRGRDPGIQTAIGERAIGWSAAGPEAGEPAPTGYTVEGTAVNGQFEVVFGLQSASDQALVMAGEHVAVSWLANGPGEELMLGLTQYEFGESDGPGFGGCPAGPGAQPPTPPASADLGATTDSVTVTWDTPAQPADSNPVTNYRVAAVNDVLGQEVAVRKGAAEGSNSATITNLDPGFYTVTIEAFNGQWSPVNELGTVDLPAGTVVPGPGGSTGGGTGGGGTGGGGTGGGAETPATVPAAPAGVTATAAPTGAVDVTWTASDGATSYVLTAASDVAGAAIPAPVTVQAPATTGSLTGLTAGTAYAVSVTANNAVGASATAGTATVTTAAPVAPAAATVTRVLSGHESATLEWQAAQAGNAASPVTGYDIVATPAPRTTNAAARPVTASVGALTNGSISGLLNGVTYNLAVFAKTGDLRGPAGTFATSVPTSVVPKDVVTVSRAQYRADRREYKISGTAQDTTANRVHIRTTTGLTIQLNVPVAADGTWSVDLRNGPVLPTDNRITVTSDSGASLTTTVTRSR